MASPNQDRHGRLSLQAPAPPHRPQATCYSLLISVAPFLSEWVQEEQLWPPWSEALLVLTGTLPLCLFQHKLLLCGFVLVTFTDGPGDMLPEPAGQRTNELRVGQLHLLAAQNRFPLHWKGAPSVPCLVAFSDKGLAILQEACVSQTLILQYELYFS